MNCPVPCNWCGDIVELHSTRKDPYEQRTLICPSCHREAEEERYQEIQQIEKESAND